MVFYYNAGKNYGNIEMQKKVHMKLVIDYYFEPMLGMTHVLIEKMYVWHDSCNDSDHDNLFLVFS